MWAKLTDFSNILAIHSLSALGSRPRTYGCALQRPWTVSSHGPRLVCSALLSRFIERHHRHDRALECQHGPVVLTLAPAPPGSTSRFSARAQERKPYETAPRMGKGRSRSSFAPSLHRPRSFPSSRPSNVCPAEPLPALLRAPVLLFTPHSIHPTLSCHARPLAPRARGPRCSGFADDVGTVPATIDASQTADRHHLFSRSAAFPTATSSSSPTRLPLDDVTAWSVSAPASLSARSS